MTRFSVRFSTCGMKAHGERATNAAVNANCLYCAIAAICMCFSALAVAASPVEAGVNTVNASELHTETTAKKPQVSCDSPDALTNSPAPHNKTQNHGKNCLVSLSAIDKQRTKKDFTLVDVRSPAEFDRYRIADSINIPLHQVKTKAFLKNRSIVLVNDGHSTTELGKTCSELKQAGFERVAVLDGGLFAWQADKRALEGDPVAQSALNRITAEELFEERAASNWSVIDASTPGKNKDMRRWLPTKFTAIPVKAKDNSFARISSVILQQRKRNPQGRLLLIADDNEAYELIDARIKKSVAPFTVLHLDGGIKGYREHVTKQLAIWDQQKQPRRYQACPG